MKKSEVTRQLIVKKAAQAFNMYGFAGTSMSKLMEVTSLEKGGLYGHFSSKEDLAVAAFEYAYFSSVDKRFSELDAIKGADKKINAFIRGFATFKSDVAGGCPVFNTAVGNMFDSPVLKKKAKDGYKKWISKISELINDAISEGTYKKINSEDVATFVLNSLEGAMVATQLTGDKELIVKASEDVIDYLTWKCRK
jgi:TetR/AcrR family transcriptional repressor of nem operon